MGAFQNLKLQIDTVTTGEAALDALTAKLDKVAGSVEKYNQRAGETAKVHESAQEKLEKFGAGVKNFIENPLQSAGSAFESTAKSLGVFGVATVGAVGAISAIATVAFESAKSLGDLGTQIANVSIRTGLSTKEVGQFSYAAKIAGTDISAFETAMRMLSKGLAEGGEEGAKARKALTDMGISARNVDGSFRPMSEVFVEISKGLNQIEGTANRNAAALAIFGRAGIELMPVMLSLSESLKRAKDLNYGLSESDVKRFEEYHRQVVELETSWDRLTRKFKEGTVATVSVFIRPMREGGRDKNLPGIDPIWGLDSDIIGDIVRERSGQTSEQARRMAAQPGIDSGNRFLAGQTSAFFGTKEGVQQQLKEAQSNVSKLRDEFLSLKDVTTDVAQAKNKAWKDAEALAGKYEQRLKGIIEAENSMFIAKPIEPGALGPHSVPSLLHNRFGRAFGSDGAALSLLAPAFVIDQEEFDKANAPGNKARSEQDAAFGLGLIAQRKSDQDARTQLQAQREQSELHHRLRMIELMAGPGGEYDAIDKQYQLRIQSAKTEVEIQEARFDREEKILDLQNKQRDSWKSATSRGFEALISGGSGGFGALLKSQAVGLGSTIAGNLGGMAWDAIGGSMPSIGGALGPLFAGTPFGAKGPTEKLDVAGTKLIAAADKLLMVGATGGASDLVPGLFGVTYGQLTGGSGKSLSGFSKFLGGMGALTTGGSLGAAITGNDYSISTGPGTATTASSLGGAGRLGTLAGGAGLVAAGTMGAISGFSAGGTQGDLMGAGSLMGMTGALLPMLSKSLSMAGPIGMIAGMGLGMISMLMGDPKAKRQAEESRELRDRRYFAPTSLDVTADGGGNYTDFDAFGSMRGSNLSAWPAYSNSGWQSSYYDKNNWMQNPGRVTSPFTPPVQVTVNTMDARSFIDNGPMIAEAVRQAVIGSQADNMVRDLRDSIAPR